MLKRAAVFFDRDNTLIISDGYLGDPAGVVLMDGAADAVAKARQYGFKVITFSNQSGVARGMFDEQAIAAVNQRMDELLVAANPAAIIEDHEYCPFHPDATVEQYRQDSPLRKPKPGMLLVAADKLSLDLSRSWVVGDAPRDIEAGHAAGCRTILFRPADVPASPAADQPSDIAPDFTVTSLREAVELIAREAFRRPTNQETSPMATDTPSSNESAPSAQTSVPRAADAPGPKPSQAPVMLVPPNAARSVVKPVAAEVDEPEARPDFSRIESLLQQILDELKGRHEEQHDFSVSKLLAGIVQILTVALLFVAYLKTQQADAGVVLLFAIALQTLTIALLIMGRQR